MNDINNTTTNVASTSKLQDTDLGYTLPQGMPAFGLVEEVKNVALDATNQDVSPQLTSINFEFPSLVLDDDPSSSSATADKIIYIEPSNTDSITTDATNLTTSSEKPVLIEETTEVTATTVTKDTSTQVKTIQELLFQVQEANINITHTEDVFNNITPKQLVFQSPYDFKVHVKADSEHQLAKNGAKTLVKLSKRTRVKNFIQDYLNVYSEQGLQANLVADLNITITKKPAHNSTVATGIITTPALQMPMTIPEHSMYASIVGAEPVVKPHKVKTGLFAKAQHFFSCDTTEVTGDALITDNELQHQANLAHTQQEIYDDIAVGNAQLKDVKLDLANNEQDVMISNPATNLTAVVDINSWVTEVSGDALLQEQVQLQQQVAVQEEQQIFDDLAVGNNQLPDVVQGLSSLVTTVIPRVQETNPVVNTGNVSHVQASYVTSATQIAQLPFSELGVEYQQLLQVLQHKSQLTSIPQLEQIETVMSIHTQLLTNSIPVNITAEQSHESKVNTEVTNKTAVSVDKNMQEHDKPTITSDSQIPAGYREYTDFHGKTRLVKLSEYYPDYQFDAEDLFKDVPIILEGRNLNKDYVIKQGFFKKTIVHAVKDANFLLHEGETLSIVGESGSGKTTLAKLLTNIEHQSSGDILFKGELLDPSERHRPKHLRKEIQVIFQNPHSSLNPRKTIFKILEEPLILNTDLSYAERKQKIEEIIELVGLSVDHLKRLPHMFSGGQKQRIAIARGLILNPSIVVADEAVSALDVSVQAQILNLMLELQKLYNLSYVFISHDLAVVKHVSHKIMVMYHGEVVEYGSVDQIFNNPQHPYTKSLLEAIPKLPPCTMEKILGKECHHQSQTHLPRFA